MRLVAREESEGKPEVRTRTQAGFLIPLPEEKVI
jgi:hypothetical protein